MSTFASNFPIQTNNNEANRSAHLTTAGHRYQLHTQPQVPCLCPKRRYDYDQPPTRRPTSRATHHRHAKQTLGRRPQRGRRLHRQAPMPFLPRRHVLRRSNSRFPSTGRHIASPARAGTSRRQHSFPPGTGYGNGLLAKDSRLHRRPAARTLSCRHVPPPRAWQPKRLRNGRTPRLRQSGAQHTRTPTSVPPAGDGLARTLLHRRRWPHALPPTGNERHTGHQPYSRTAMFFDRQPTRHFRTA